MRHVNTKDAQKNAAESPKVLVNNMHHCSDSYQTSKVLTLMNVCISACTYVCHVKKCKSDFNSFQGLDYTFDYASIVLLMTSEQKCKCKKKAMRPEHENTFRG